MNNSITQASIDSLTEFAASLGLVVLQIGLTSEQLRAYNNLLLNPVKPVLVTKSKGAFVELVVTDK